MSAPQKTQVIEMPPSVVLLIYFMHCEFSAIPGSSSGTICLKRIITRHCDRFCHNLCALHQASGRRSVNLEN